MSINVLLVCCYTLFLVLTAYGFDHLAKRTAVRAQRWRTGSFRYHQDHDAWKCPQDQWLWPTSFDPEQRVVRYRAKPSVCNSCPVKDTCTTSSHGREVSREIDPWPYSEAGRFHRGIACAIAVLAIVLPAAMLLSRPSTADLLALLAAIGIGIGAGIPLARHLWSSPTGFPEHIPQVSVYEEASTDRFSTTWGSFTRRPRSVSTRGERHAMTTAIIVGLTLLVVAILALATSMRVLREYERGVVFRLGRLQTLYDPGLRRVLPVVDRMIKVDLRLVTLTIPPQEVITRDNVPARVNAVVLFRVIDPVKSVMEVENFAVATSQIAQTSLRSLLGRVDLDTLLAHRENLNEDLATTIAAQTMPWGVEVRVVEIKDVEIPEAMQRAMAREAEAERERRAKIINARGELQASEELRQAAEILSRNPASLQLRYLQTLLELGADQNSTVVFPLPIDIVGPFLNSMVHNDVSKTVERATSATNGTEVPR